MAVCQSAFATLHSRIHETWVRLLSSTMGEGLRYSATDCFDTFPFPKHNPREILPAVDQAGTRLAALRAEYMLEENVGLTTLYNRLKDPAHADPRIAELRAVHESIDAAVLAAYGEADAEGRWHEVAVPPYCSAREDVDMRLEVFEDQVIDRLFELNARRAGEENDTGLGAGGGKKSRPKKAVRSKAGKRKQKGEEQLSLFGDDEK